MQCPSCGYENVSGAERCASCGRPLPQTIGQGYGLQSSGEPPSMPPGGPYQPPSSMPQQPSYPTPGTQYGEMPGQPNVPPQPTPQPWSGPVTPGAQPPAGYGAPTPPSGYGMPPQQPGYGAPTPPSGYGTVPPQQPGYGAPTPPSTPYAGYGQAAPPSYPMQPGQPGQPGWQYPPGYGPGGQPPQRRSRTGLIVGIVIAVIVVLVACSVGGLVLVNQAGNLTSTVGTATATATTAPTATPAETVLFQSALTTSSSKMVQNENCFFSSDGYHIKDNFICPINIDNLSDVHVKVTAKQIKGSLSNPYGVAFRESSSGWYELDISGDGGWGVFNCPPNTGTCSELVQPSGTNAVQKNLNQENLLEVTAQGTHFEFSVNGSKLGTADDSSLTSGKIALSCGPGMECVYTNLTISKPAA